MLEEYYEYFGSRVAEFDEYLQADDAGQAAREAVTVARDVAQRNGLALRPDAALLISFLSDELVARPVLSVRPDQQDQVALAITEDVSQIISAAVGFGSAEITAHTVIDALSSSWQNLATAQFQVWDGR